MGLALSRQQPFRWLAINLIIKLDSFVRGSKIDTGHVDLIVIVLARLP